MHILAILVFLLALIVAGEVIRSTLAANGTKILAALEGKAPAPSHGVTFINFQTRPPGNSGRLRVVSPPVELPLAA